MTERSACVRGLVFLVAAAAHGTGSGSVWDCRLVVAVTSECSLGTIATCAPASLACGPAAAALDDQRSLRRPRAGPASARPRNHAPGFAAFAGSAAAASHSGVAGECALAVARIVVAVRAAGATAGLGEVG